MPEAETEVRTIAKMYGPTATVLIRREGEQTILRPWHRHTRGFILPPTADGKWLVHVIDDGAHQSFDWHRLQSLLPHLPITRRHHDETHRPAATGVMARPHRR
ncbi:MAG: hypothetical protein ABR555_15845 [Pyrinomonadaceae bacterium]